MDALLHRKYILGSSSIVGDPRRKWEDRVFVEEIPRPGWDSIIVGIVADGVGSADFGARGAQLAVDSVVEYIRQSQGNDYSEILESAIEAANSAVFNENQTIGGDGLSTLVVVMIVRDRAYVGNVGDSRVYWVQADGKILQLTRDHNYGNIYGGTPTKDESLVLINAIGKNSTVQVDLGFYLKGDDIEQAFRLGVAGLPLKIGDSLLICSDGLYKTGPREERYIKDSEIFNALQTEKLPNHAAIKMVSMVEGRKPDDNVSAVTIQVAPATGFQESVWRSLYTWLLSFSTNSVVTKKFGVVFTSLLGLMILFFVTGQLLSQETKEFPVLTDAIPTFEISTVTDVVPVTQSPAHPIIVSMLVQSVDIRKGASNAGATVNQSEKIESGRQISTYNETGVSLVGVVVKQNPRDKFFLYIFQESAIKVNFDDRLKPVLLKGALMLNPGATNFSEVSFSDPDNLYARVLDGRMIVEVRGSNFWLYCLEGNCQWVVGREVSRVPEGYKSAFVRNKGYVDVDFQKLTEDEKRQWHVECNLCMPDLVTEPTPTQGNFPLKPDSGNNIQNPCRQNPKLCPTPNR